MAAAQLRRQNAIPATMVVSSTAAGLISDANRLMEALKARLARLVSIRDGCELTGTGIVPHAAMRTNRHHKQAKK